MSKEIKIKSNGLRNELKEIRKEIAASRQELNTTLRNLTNAILMAQTHKHNETINYTNPSDVLSGMRWEQSTTASTRSDSSIQEPN